MVKVSVLKELNAIRAQVVFHSCHRLEGALIFGLASKATIARLEVGSLNVGLSERVEARVQLPAGIEGVSELDL